MQFRMAKNPALAAKVNRETIPVAINLTDQGFPENLPALDYWKELHARDVWSHFAFAVWFLLDADGDENYGFYGCHCEEHLRLDAFRLDTLYTDLEAKLDTYLARYHAVRKLEATRRNPAAAGALAALRSDLQAERDHGRVCADDRRLFTARVILGRGPAPWSRIVKTLADGDSMELGVREAAIRTLADFVTNDRPFADAAADHVEAIYEQIDADERERLVAETRAERAAVGADFRVTDLPVPPSLRREAARALTTIVGLAAPDRDDQLVARVRAWWAQAGALYAHTPQSELPSVALGRSEKRP